MVNKSESFDDQPKTAKRKLISSNIKSNSVITADKNRTADSDEETNKQKLSNDTTEIAKSLSNIIVSKKRTQISSLEQSKSEIVEDKDKSPTNEEPVEKSPNNRKSYQSDYYNNFIKDELKDQIKENNKDSYIRNKEKRKENYQNIWPGHTKISFFKAFSVKYNYNLTIL